MRVIIKCKDNVVQPYLINKKNWPALKEKYGDRIQIAEPNA
jgi:hypothetical protein